MQGQSGLDDFQQPAILVEVEKEEEKGDGHGDPLGDADLPRAQDDDGKGEGENGDVKARGKHDYLSLFSMMPMVSAKIKEAINATNASVGLTTTSNLSFQQSRPGINNECRAASNGSSFHC
jgi:hypothetical protein